MASCHDTDLKKRIEKEPAESLSESRGAFWKKDLKRTLYEQLHEAPVTQALLGIGQRDAQACSNNTCLCGRMGEGGGVVSAVREECEDQIQTSPPPGSQSAADTIMKEQ